MKTLQVMIEGRTYPLKVNEEDAASMLKIVEEVNESLKSLHVSYPQKDRQDCMAMDLLTYAVKLYESRADSLSPDIQEKLEVMERLLDEVML